MDPTAFAYVFLLLAGLFYLAEWLAPYHDLSEKGCVLGYVYDGDTVELKCGAESLTARLQGFDTPETKDPGCAEEAAHGALAKDRLRQLVKSGPLKLDSHGTDKYGRVLATMQIRDRDVADIPIEEGLAKPYSGGTRINWCRELRAGG